MSTGGHLQGLKSGLRSSQAQEGRSSARQAQSTPGDL